MQTLERTSNVKPIQDTASIAELIERLQSLEIDQTTQINFNITEVVKKESEKKYSNQLKKFLADIDQFGGMSLETSEEHQKHSKEFREGFFFKADL